MKTISTIVLLLSLTYCFSQSVTLVNGKTYNHVEYFENGTIKVLGTIKDSVKTGKWIYYKLDNTVLAKGTYENGYATGKWVYNDYGYRRTKDWDWEKRLKPSTVIVVKNEMVIIKQNCMSRRSVLEFYENGKKVNEWFW